MINEANILIIDDEAVIRDGCGKILKRDGWKVETCKNGKDGLEMMKGRYFDILLLDLMMPGMSGLELIPLVKEINSDIYIIVITGYATIETAVEAIKTGAFDYISKPFTSEQLRVAIRRVLENKSLRLEAEYLRKEQEKGLLAIAQEKSKIKTILDCMPDGLLVIDEEKKIALYNPMACKLLNIASESAIGEPVDKCIGCDELTGIVLEVMEGSPDKQIRIAKEIERESFASLMIHAAPVQMEDGRIIGTVVILRDISDQKLLEKMKSDFIAKVTHEIKAPAATINQLLMTLLSGAAGELEEEQKHIIERTRYWGDGLLELVTDLLNISKFESGQSLQQLEPIKMNDVIDQAIDLIKPQADKKKIKLSKYFDDSLPEIIADSKGMRDVFVNLISNAVKYSDEGTEVTITGKLDNQYLNISVIDNGFGIEEEDIPFLFDKFFRVRDKKTRYIMGTGLGLPIAKQIIDAHNGLIKVYSEVNKGSTFSVFLPAMI